MKRRARRRATAARGRRGPPRRLVLGVRDPDMRARLARALRGEGHLVLEFRHAVEITKHIMETALDPHGLDAEVLISDVAIPGATPLEILEYLRALDPAAHLILLAESADRSTRASARKLDATLVGPPFETRDLLDAVRDALGERPRVRAIREAPRAETGPRLEEPVLAPT